MNPKFSIKAFDQLSTLELHALLKLRAEVFVVEQECFYLDPDDEDLVGYHLLVMNHNALLAYTRCYQDGNHSWHIGRVVVHADHRRKGLAKEMMQRILDHINSISDSPQIELSAQAYLEPFYRSISFKSVGNIYLDAGLPHIRMLYQEK